MGNAGFISSTVRVGSLRKEGLRGFRVVFEESRCFRLGLVYLRLDL